ncbi:MAG: hypothetical protein HYX39_03465 [Bacteroidetes bacterium]|nr:hypothetical protein [Bacteroidota bacterium]
MALDKILNNIRLQVKDLDNILTIFLDDSIQPSVSDCETLQHQINHLEECLAIYKFQKTNKEISPSFNIHAKVSEKQSIIAETEQIIPSAKKTEEVSKPIAKKTEHSPDPHKNLPPLAIGINDKFRFINELFKQNNAEYNIAMEQLAGLQSWPDTELYLNSLKNLYEWNDNSEVVIYFNSLIKKRYH